MKKNVKNLKHQGFPHEIENLHIFFLKIDVDVCLLHVETLYSKIRHI